MTSREYEINPRDLELLNKSTALNGNAAVYRGLVGHTTKTKDLPNGNKLVEEEEIFMLNGEGYDLGAEALEYNNTRIKKLLEYNNTRIKKLKEHNARVLSSKVELISKRRAKRKLAKSLAKIAKRRNRN